MASSVFLGGSGGGGTPASPVNSIQFNNSGSFGGTANLETNTSGDIVQGGPTNTTTQTINQTGVPNIEWYVVADSFPQFAVYRDTGADQTYLQLCSTGESCATGIDLYANGPLSSGADIWNIPHTVAYTMFGGDTIIDIGGGTNKLRISTADSLASETWNFKSDGSIVTVNSKNFVLTSAAEFDITSASGTSGTTPGSHVVITAGDGSTSGAGGNVYLNAGGSGSGTPGDIILTSSDFIQVLGPVIFGTNGVIGTGKTNANDLTLRAWDVNDSVYRNLMVLTAGNTPSLVFNPASSTITMQATTYKSSDGSTGATGTANNTNTLTIKNGLVTNIA